MKRDWVIAYDDFVDDYGNVNELAYRDACTQAMAESENILHRLGGSVSILALRVLIEGDYQPNGLHFHWESFVPADKREPQPAEDTPDVTDSEDELAAAA